MWFLKTLFYLFIYIYIDIYNKTSQPWISVERVLKVFQKCSQVEYVLKKMFSHKHSQSVLKTESALNVGKNNLRTVRTLMEHYENIFGTQ